MVAGRVFWNHAVGVGDGRMYCDPPHLFDSLERAAAETAPPATSDGGAHSVVFSLKFAGVIQLRTPDGTTENHYSRLRLEKYAVSRAEFAADAHRLTRDMIASSSAGPELRRRGVVDSLAGGLVSAALGAAEDPVLVAEALPVFLCLSSVTQYGEREDFERAVAADEEARAVPRAAASAVEGLKEVAIDPNSGSAREVCAVCLEELGGEEAVVSLPCSHLYHRRCGVRWLETAHSCPLCRYAMPTETEASS